MNGASQNPTFAPQSKEEPPSAVSYSGRKTQSTSAEELQRATGDFSPVPQEFDIFEEARILWKELDNEPENHLRKIRKGKSESCILLLTPPFIYFQSSV